MKIETKFDVGDYVYKIMDPYFVFKIEDISFDKNGIIYSSNTRIGIFVSGKESELTKLYKESD